ncbi:MAG: hypothetical protein ACRYHQ_24270 [Janthinobacterium lividum]
MTREFRCEGCGQRIIDKAGYPAPASVPDICGGCFLLGPHSYVERATKAGWFKPEELERAHASLATFRERWGDEMTETGTTEACRVEATRRMGALRQHAPDARRVPLS